MDGNRFDDLARMLATRSDRRGALKRLAGAAAASTLAFLGLNQTGIDALASASTTDLGPADGRRSARLSPGPRTRPTTKGRHQTGTAATPTVVLTPTSGKIKAAVSATLSGFRSNETITLLWFDGSTSKIIATGLTSSGGKATINFEAPYAFRGYHVVRATGNRGSVGEAKFAIVPSFTLKPKSGNEGDTVKTSLSGYASRAKVDIWFFPGETSTGTPQKLTTVTLSATGTGATNIVVPNGAQTGLHRIEGREQVSGRLASARFRVNECVTAGDCPLPGNECLNIACVAGMCETMTVPEGTPIANQTAGDCQQEVCDGDGQTTFVADDGDVFDDGNDCTIDTCSNGAPSQTPENLGVACASNGGKVCDGNGTCVSCNASSDCPGSDTECAFKTCTSHMCGFDFIPAGTLCTGGICDGNGTCSPTVCTPNEIRSCYEGPPGTEDVGICHAGSQSCGSDGSAWGPCNDQQQPLAEMCNGQDDNCDGQIDDGYPVGDSCDGGGTLQCSPDGTGVICVM